MANLYARWSSKENGLASWEHLNISAPDPLYFYSDSDLFTDFSDPEHTKLSAVANKHSNTTSLIYFIYVMPSPVRSMKDLREKICVHITS